MNNFFKQKWVMWAGISLALLLVLYFIFKEDVDNFFYRNSKSEKDVKSGSEGLDETLNLKKGSKGREVAELQRLLKADGANLGSYGPAKDGVDGIFGSATEKELNRIKGVKEVTLSKYKGLSLAFSQVDITKNGFPENTGVAGPISISEVA